MSCSRLLGGGSPHCPVVTSRCLGCSAAWQQVLKTPFEEKSVRTRQRLFVPRWPDWCTIIQSRKQAQGTLAGQRQPKGRLEAENAKLGQPGAFLGIPEGCLDAHEGSLERLHPLDCQNGSHCGPGTLYCGRTRRPYMVADGNWQVDQYVFDEGVVASSNEEPL